MRISLLRIINFKQFYKEQTVDLSTENDLNVTVFHGDNGTGKTSLFTAINWCLYGVGDEGTGELLNKQIFTEINDGNKIPVVVTIQFRHEGFEYIAERCRYFKKVGQAAIVENDTFTLSSVDHNGNTRPIANPEGKMDSILPRNVREYFFFNGEKMDDLTKPGNGKIEDAIKNIMRLPIIDKTESHLIGVAKDYRKEIQRNGNVTIDQLISEQNDKEQEIERLRALIKENEIEINTGNKLVEDLERKLAESREVGLLQQQRKQYEKSIGELETLRANVINEIQKSANLVYPKLLSAHAEKALQVISKQVAKGKIPSGIREQFLENLIEQEVCICGREFEKGSESYKTLLRLLQSTQSSEFEDEVLNLRGYIRSNNNLTNDRLVTLVSGCKSVENITNQIEESLRIIDDLRRKIGNSEDVDIVRIETKRDEFKKRIGLKNNEIGGYNFRIEQLRTRINEILRERNIEERKQDELRFLNLKERLATASANAVTTIKERFYEETRKQIEAETKKVFGNLAWKQDQFDDIRLDPCFHLEVIDRWGKPSREELSAGERQILSLSFIAAMARLSGEEAPVIMDTPFARLSGKHLENTSTNIPDLVPQLILFVTDKEWNDSSKSGLEPRVGYHYQLLFSEGRTVIKEVDFD